MLYEIVITIGPPGSGKSTFTAPLEGQGYVVVSRDALGGQLGSPDGLVYQEIRMLYGRGRRRFVIDGTYGTVAVRAAALAVGKELGLPVRALWLQVPLEQAQLFASRRQIQRYGTLFKRGDYKTHKSDPNMFPPAAQFAFRKQFEEPTLAEGFASIEKVDIQVVWGPEYVNRAILLDLDGTVRETPDVRAGIKKGCPWPRNVDEVEVLPGCGEVLRRKQAEGYLLLAVTNQSGISRDPKDSKYVSEEQVQACIEATAEKLGITFDDYLYAEDQGGAPSTFWRKPCPGMGVVFIEKHKLDPSQCIMVGDMKTDATFADRCGFQFEWAHDFFGG